MSRAELGDLLRSDVAYQESRFMSGGTTAVTRHRRYDDGRQIVVKQSDRRDSDAEYLASLVGEAIGAPVPTVIRVSDDEVWMGLVDGDSGMTIAEKAGLNPYEVTDDWEELWADREPGWRLGLLDVLIENADRHHANWMLADPSNPSSVVGIDHGRAWWVADDRGPGFHALRPIRPGERPYELGPQWASIRTAVFDWDSPTGWNTDPRRMTLREAEQVDARLRALAPEFAALGRQVWFDHTVANWSSYMDALRGAQ